MRLHVIDDEVHGELIESDAVDYRTASARFVPFEPPPALAASVRTATRHAGLLFAGWDSSSMAMGGSGAWKRTRCRATTATIHARTAPYLVRSSHV